MRWIRPALLYEVFTAAQNYVSEIENPVPDRVMIDATRDKLCEAVAKAEKEHLALSNRRRRILRRSKQT